MNFFTALASIAIGNQVTSSHKEWSIDSRKYEVHRPYSNASNITKTLEPFVKKYENTLEAISALEILNNIDHGKNRYPMTNIEDAKRWCEIARFLTIKANNNHENTFVLTNKVADQAIECLIFAREIFAYCAKRIAQSRWKVSHKKQALCLARKAYEANQKILDLSSRFKLHYNYSTVHTRL